MFDWIWPCLDLNLGESGSVKSRLRALPLLPSLPRFSEDFRSRFFAGAAARRHAKLALQLPEIPHASGRGLANLLVSNGVADTDVHKFNHLACLSAFKRKCE